MRWYVVEDFKLLYYTEKICETQGDKVARLDRLSKFTGHLDLWKD